jgi:hypothetical protein
VSPLWPEIGRKLRRSLSPGGLRARGALPRFRADRIEVALMPESVELTRLSPRGAAMQRSYPVAEPTWQAACAAFNHAMHELGWRNARTRVRLSNHFVRYALIPGADKLRNHSERIAAARHQLRTLYGEKADGWLVVPAATGGDFRLAAAVDSGLIEALGGTALDANLQLQRIEPLLAYVYNEARRGIDSTPTWLVVAEPGRICVAYFENRHWRLVRNERLRGSMEQELPVMLARLSLAENAFPGRVLLCGAQGPSPVFETPLWKVEPFTPRRKKEGVL